MTAGPTAEPSTASTVPPPTRDELVAAWGDHVLSQLRPRVRAVFAVGRFLASEDGAAVLALPNSAHVDRASFDCGEVSEALSRHFGRPVDLRLVAETGFGTGYSAPPAASSGRRSPEQGGDAHSPTAPPAGARTEAPRSAAGGIPPGTSGASRGRGRAAPPPGMAAGFSAEGADDEMLDPDDLDPDAEIVAGDRISWAQDRVMEAFPGAEEV